MMNADAKFSLHGVTGITTRCVWINGTWHREIIIATGDDGRLTMALYGDDKLALSERPDEYVNVVFRNALKYRIMRA